MRPLNSRAVVVAALVSLPGVTACSEEKKPEAAPSAAAPAPSAPPSPVPVPLPEVKKKRPDKIDTEVTAERRAKIEAAIPEAKGFLVASELEEKLKANKTLKEKEAGVKAFDKLAQGKWILFAGPLSNPTAVGFDLGITYTPQIPGDVMGMSRQWFPVTFSSVKGYVSEDMKVGQTVITIAKYGGKQKATPGEELVATERW